MYLIGSRIGDVQILEVLGEGGMGTVYAGFDERLEREVAVKVVRNDRLDAVSRAHLLREARMLSRLDHAHVCRLYGYIEGEESDFLILERLRGVTLKNALDAGRRFSPAVRLRLAEEIAETLRVAHARGIVHRDLSPANVMLVGEDENLSVKVLDFGLAKPVGADALAPNVDDTEALQGTPGSHESVLTEIGRITGTPGALSPEQARGEALTTASDMYSFGLLSQFLLTGESPLESGLKPHQKVAKALKAETRPVRGLDAESTRFIATLLSPRPEDRPSASQAVETLRRIRDRPKRLARAGLVAFMVLAILGGAAKYFVDLRSERNRALEAEERALYARGRAEQARAEAEKVSDFLVSVFSASKPGSVAPEEITARQILDEGSARIDKELAEKPLIQARLYDAVGRVFLGLGLYSEARERQERALEIRRRFLTGKHPDLAVSLLRNTEVALRQGRFDEAHALSQEAMHLVDGEGQIPFDVRSGIVSALGLLSMQRGEFDKAEKIFSDFLGPTEAEKGAESLPVSNILNNLAVVHLERQEFSKAEPLLERVLAIRIQTLGPVHVAIARARGNLASTYAQNRGPKASEDLHRQVLETLTKVQGDAHPDVAQACESLAAVLLAQGFFEETELLFKRSLEIREKALGPDHPSVAQSHDNLGALALRRQEHTIALMRLEKASAIKLSSLGPEHPLTLKSQILLAQARREAGDPAAAEILLESVLERRSAAQGHEAKVADPILTEARRQLALHYAATERPQEALALMQQVLEADRLAPEGKMTRPTVLRVSTSLWQRSQIFQEMGRSARVLEDRREMVELLEPVVHGDDVETIEPLARALLALGRDSQAEPWLEALERLSFPIETAPELAKLVGK